METQRIPPAKILNDTSSALRNAKLRWKLSATHTSVLINRPAPVQNQKKSISLTLKKLRDGTETRNWKCFQKKWLFMSLQKRQQLGFDFIESPTSHCGKLIDEKFRRNFRWLSRKFDEGSCKVGSAVELRFRWMWGLFGVNVTVDWFWSALMTYVVRRSKPSLERLSFKASRNFTRAQLATGSQYK